VPLWKLVPAFGRSRNPASNLHDKPYNLRQYGFNPVIRYGCRDGRRNVNDATPYLFWQFDPVWDWRRGFFHQRRECSTSGDTQSGESLFGCRTSRRDDYFTKSGGTGVAVRSFCGQDDGFVNADRSPCEVSGHYQVKSAGTPETGPKIAILNMTLVSVCNASCVILGAS
jgi:hypothetical protein